MDKRRYSEHEISMLLKRATELQEEHDTKAHRHDGLTLEEVQQIAHEVGVDPALVAWAVEEMKQPTLHQDRFQLWGGPIKRVRTRYVRGDLTDDTMDQLVRTIREQLGQEGSFEKLGTTLTWKGKEKNADVVIKAFHRAEGGTAIESTQNLWQVALLSFYLPLFFTVILGIGFMQEKVFLSPELETLIMGVLLVAEFLAIRTGYGYWNRKKQQEMDTLVRQLDAVICEATPEPESQTASPALDLPGATDAEIEIASPQRSRTR